jgi:NitT/TauT family transport system substrate-binding protein
VRTSQFGPPGVQTVEGWQSEYEMAQTFGGLKSPPPIETMMDPDLVASLYQDGVLIWPEK